MAEAKNIAQLLVNDEKVEKQEEVAYPKPFSNEIQFDRNQVLGIGNSVVFHGTYNGLPVAVKRIEVFKLSKEDREIRTQVKLDHENVLKIVTVEQDLDFRYIVLELCEGTLAGVINKTYKRPELSSDMNVLNEIATGVHYIHSKKLVHRDIKPDNILISSNGRIKISDFDLCKETSTNHTYLVSGPFKGTKFWMPKELWIVPDNNSTPIKGSIESDIFSAGCVFFYFVTRGIHPFGDDKFDNSEIQQNIVDGNVVNFHRLNQSHFASDIIRAMLQHEPNERITLEEILRRFEYQLITLALMDEKRAANIVRHIAEKNNPFVVYNLPIEKYHETNSLRVDYYVFGKPNSSALENSMRHRKTILMVEFLFGDVRNGMKCSETVIVINAMINYVLDVKWEDNFRFKMIDETFIHKGMVTLFHLNAIEGSRLGYPLTIIVINKPEESDYFRYSQRIDEEFKNIFYYGEMKQLNAICFTLQLEKANIDLYKRMIDRELSYLSRIFNFSDPIENKCRFFANFAKYDDFNKFNMHVFWSPPYQRIIAIWHWVEVLSPFAKASPIPYWAYYNELLYKFICLPKSNEDVQNEANFKMNVNRFDKFFQF